MTKFIQFLTVGLMLTSFSFAGVSKFVAKQAYHAPKRAYHGAKHVAKAGKSVVKVAYKVVY